MLSYGANDDDDANHNLTIDHCNLARVSSSSSSCNYHSPFSNAVRTMEEVWKDINLSATNHRDASVKAVGYRGFILQDFLAKPFSSNDTPSTAVSPPGYGSPSSPPLPPPMLLNLNSGPDQMNFLTEDQALDVPASGLLGSNNGNGGRMRMFPASGGDRRHKRMIKNRESAARSRASGLLGSNNGNGGRMRMFPASGGECRHKRMIKNQSRRLGQGLENKNLVFSIKYVNGTRP
ncbi:hypothetical protein SSX86_011664 [Deinandra increscens subsp. villosa]|uniref:BZIP domain-containing protein n=1 Tax=Deinandra increscens subsp. villosa TaxID=3103831 RepID=A0AAP0DAB9_9ASTR